MNNQLIQVKIKDRVNKVDSSDYQNIEPYQFVEAFNKAQDAWVRRQLEGINQTKTGAEGSIRRIDDLQRLITEWSVTWIEQDLFWKSPIYPTDYLEWCRISAYGQDDCKDCPPRRLVIFEGNEADLDMYLADVNRRPDYNWATTFCTVSASTFKIWTNGLFNIVDPLLVYYRSPLHIQITGVRNPDTGFISVADVLCELPDGVIELIIDEAAAIICGDIENWQQRQRLTTDSEHNN